MSGNENNRTGSSSSTSGTNDSSRSNTASIVQNSQNPSISKRESTQKSTQKKTRKINCVNCMRYCVVYFVCVVVIGIALAFFLVGIILNIWKYIESGKSNIHFSLNGGGWFPITIRRIPIKRYVTFHKDKKEREGVERNQRVTENRLMKLGNLDITTYSTTKKSGKKKKNKKNNKKRRKHKRKRSGKQKKKKNKKKDEEEESNQKKCTRRPNAQLHKSLFLPSHNLIIIHKMNITNVVYQFLQSYDITGDESDGDGGGGGDGRKRRKRKEGVQQDKKKNENHKKKTTILEHFRNYLYSNRNQHVSAVSFHQFMKHFQTSFFNPNPEVVHKLSAIYIKGKNRNDPPQLAINPRIVTWSIWSVPVNVSFFKMVNKTIITTETFIDIQGKKQTKTKTTRIPVRKNYTRQIRRRYSILLQYDLWVLPPHEKNTILVPVSRWYHKGFSVDLQEIFERFLGPTTMNILMQTSFPPPMDYDHGFQKKSKKKKKICKLCYYSSLS